MGEIFKLFCFGAGLGCIVFLIHYIILVNRNTKIFRQKIMSGKTDILCKYRDGEDSDIGKVKYYNPKNGIVTIKSQGNFDIRIPITSVKPL